MAALRVLEQLQGFLSCSQSFEVKCEMYPIFYEKSFKKGTLKPKNCKKRLCCFLLSLFRYLQRRKIANLSPSSLWRLYHPMHELSRYKTCTVYAFSHVVQFGIPTKESIHRVLCNKCSLAKSAVHLILQQFNCFSLFIIFLCCLTL